MNRIKSKTLLAGLAMGAVVLGGACGAGGTGTVAEGEETPRPRMTTFATGSATPVPPIVTPTPEPEETGPAVDPLKNTLVTESGHRIQVEIGERVIETSHDIENQKPGYALISVEMSADATFTNLTRRHRADPDLLWVMPAWKSKSIMCDEDVREVAAAYGRAYYIYSISGENVWHNDPKSFCTIEGVWVPINSGVTLDVDETETIELSQSANSSSIMATEENLEAVEEALQSPDFWILNRNVSPEQASAEGVCRDQARTRAVVAVTPVGKEICAKIKTDD
jgi:hypothetical protein